MKGKKMKSTMFLFGNGYFCLIKALLQSLSFTFRDHLRHELSIILKPYIRSIASF